VDIFVCPYKFQSVLQSHEGYWQYDRKCGGLATTKWTSGLVYQGPYVNDLKHGEQGKLDYSGVYLNKKAESTVTVNWTKNQPDKVAELPARAAKNILGR